MKYLIAILMMSVTVQASDIWDIANSRILKSKNEIRYLESDLVTPKAGYLVDPDRSAVRTSALDSKGRIVYTNTTHPKYWKVSGNALVPMTKAERDDFNAGEADKADTRATKASKERKIDKGTRLAAIAALLEHGLITQAKHDTWITKELAQ